MNSSADEIRLLMRRVPQTILGQENSHENLIADFQENWRRSSGGIPRNVCVA
jgi:hypothetical protein